MGEHDIESVARPSRVAVDTFADRIHVEWDSDAAVTPMGQLPFFIEFLKVRQFLSTERGKQVLANMDGVTASQQLPVIPPNGAVMPVNKPPDESISAKSGT